MPQQITTEIEIAATAERVWQELTNFKNYPQWNPFIKQIAGELTEGAALQIKLIPPEGKPMVFNPTIIEIKPEKRFVWLGRVLFPGRYQALSILVHGKRIFPTVCGWLYPMMNRPM